MIDHHSYTHNLSSCEIKAWIEIRPEIKNSGLNGIQTHDPCATSAVLYQPSYQPEKNPSGSWSHDEFVIYL